MAGAEQVFGNWLFKKRNTKWLWKQGTGPEKRPFNRKALKLKLYLLHCTWTSGLEVLLQCDWRKWMRCVTSQVKITFRKGKLESLLDQFKHKVYDRKCWSLLLVPGQRWFWLMWCCFRDNLLQIKGFAMPGLAPQLLLWRGLIKKPGTSWPSQREVTK